MYNQTNRIFNDDLDMGQSSRKLPPTQLEDLTRKTTFSRDELKQWYELFMKDYPSGYMNREQFLKVYKDYYKHGDPSGFSEHVFRVFDVNNDGKIGKIKFKTFNIITVSLNFIQTKITKTWIDLFRT